MQNLPRTKKLAGANQRTGEDAMTENQAELYERIRQKIKDGEGKVSFAFGIEPILNEAKVEFHKVEMDTIYNHEHDYPYHDYHTEMKKLIKKWFGEP
jgi:hypothetical protein